MQKPTGLRRKHAAALGQLRAGAFAVNVAVDIEQRAQHRQQARCTAEGLCEVVVARHAVGEVLLDAHAHR